MKSKSLKKFKSIKYQDIGMNDLICYSILACKNEEKITVTREEMVIACFKLFPDKFSLRGHDDLPDSSVVDKRWVDCRDKGFISGKTSMGFDLTSLGHIKAKEVIKKMKIKNKGQVKAIKENRTEAGRHISRLLSSDAWNKFSKDKSINNISMSDLRELLLCTMETPNSIVIRAYDQLLNNCRIYKRKDLVKFLELLKEKFLVKLFNPLKTGKYTGGMIKKLG